MGKAEAISVWDDRHAKHTDFIIKHSVCVLKYHAAAFEYIITLYQVHVYMHMYVCMIIIGRKGEKQVYSNHNKENNFRKSVCYKCKWERKKQ